MSNSPMLSLYELLPAVYRIDDEKNGGVLKAFLAVVEEQAAVVKDNIGQLYDDLFIETCQEWVIPYIGDLVGNKPLYEVLRTRRADVARTLYYRRRKGTLPVLEELARDVTDWSVRAVPFFERLVWSQHMNHVRDAGKTADVRDLQVMDLFGGPFDTSAHTVDIREMTERSGRYHPKRVGFFAWRLNNHHVDGGTALREAMPNAHGFHFSPFGLTTRLFQRPEDLEIGTLTEERHVRQPIRPAAFFADPAAFYDPTVTPSVHRLDGVTFSAPVSVTLMDLSALAQPGAGVGIDVVRGLVSFAAAEVPAQAGVSYRNAAPQLAARMAMPNDHIFSFPLLGLEVFHDGGLVPVDDFQYMDLSHWPRPAAGRVGVDLGLGRLSFAAGEEPTTDVTHRFGPGDRLLAVQADAPNEYGFLLQLPANPASLRLAHDGVPVAASQLACMQLNHWTRPGALHVGVDVQLGRISFPAGEEPSGAVVVSYDYGFAADLGGGTYDRLAPIRPGDTVDTTAAKALRDPKTFYDPPVLGDPPALDLRVGLEGHATINAALDAWRAEGRPNSTITIQDSRTYVEDLLLDLASHSLVLQAANNCRPAVRGVVRTTGGNGAAAIVLSGLWMDTNVAAEGNLKELVISHGTIAATGPDSVRVDPSNVSITVDVDRSILSGIRIPPESILTLTDSITGPIEGEAEARIERVTVFGTVDLREVSLISECIVMGVVSIARRQAGCVRYSYLPAESLTPGRYRCQPDLAIEDLPAAQVPAATIRMIPAFTSTAYGDAGFAQLSAICAREISAGGEDGGEMGAFQLLQQGRREANLHMRLDEYLPFGLRAGIIYAN